MAKKRGKRGGGGEERAEEALPGDPGFAWDQLPEGVAQEHREKLYVLPQKAFELAPPKVLGWRLGSRRAGIFRPWGRARILVDTNFPCLDVDEPRGLEALLAGQSQDAPIRSGVVGLIYRGLPLGFLTVKNGRALWSDR